MESKRALLIVDDIEINRAILVEVFCKEYEIMEAENGKEALELLEANEERIAAIFLDLVMPVMDGFGVLEEMNRKQLMSQIPVFLITAEDSNQALKRGYDLGVMDIVRKPFDIHFIHRRLNNVIELCRHRNKLDQIVQQQVEKLEEQARELRRINTTMIDTLSTVIEFRDCESGEHVQRIRGVTNYLLHKIAAIFPEYGLDENKIALISDASAMHDIGKISIPDYILNKPGRLTPEEFAIMKEHSLRGCEILERVDALKGSEIYEYCYDICRHHHERWDGKGYPDGLRGDEITIWSQCVALADVYDALISPRVYKPAYSHEKAVKMIIGGECGAFNPALLLCFQSVEADIYHSLYEGNGVDRGPLYERKEVERA